MKIGFVGAGKVAMTFGWYLKTKGLNVLGFSSRTNNSADIAAFNTQTKTLSLEDLVLECDTIFLTTPDGAIETVCNQISTDIGFRTGQTVVHMSGALKSQILAKAKEQGANVFSLHPMQAFADFEKSKRDITNTFFTFEGVGNDHNLINILHKIGNPYARIEPEHKSLYHAAACISSNYLVTLASIAFEVFSHIGFSQKEAKAVLLPLMKGTLNNIEDLGVEQALTGPLLRGDVKTIEDHQEKLKEFSNIHNFYCNLGTETLEIARKRGLSTEHLNAIKKILNRGVKNE